LFLFTGGVYIIYKQSIDPLIRYISTHIDPSATSLPLRSPRVDQPTTPRLIQKASRIQILDIQQGNEIMQSMNDAKAKLEQGTRLFFLNKQLGRHYFNNIET
jgi:hypothetical protein